MHALAERIQALTRLGEALREILQHYTTPEQERARAAVALSFHKNGWFTEPEVKRSLHYWSEALTQEKLTAWLDLYDIKGNSSLDVGLILAGNIPLVGFHDIVCTLLSGHRAIIKPSSSDHVLIEWLMELMVETTPNSKDWFEIRTERMKSFDAVIATGSNNSARYFEQYFGNVPHIIRKNRTSVAVLDGNESEKEMQGLIEDILSYYGLGCRNVTKVFVPSDYALNKIFAASLPFAHAMSNNKYANNYAYHRTLMMMEQKDVLENDVLLITPSQSLFSPVSVLHYEHYDNPKELSVKLEAQAGDIQCIVSRDQTPFGKAQRPDLQDYADGVDTMSFLRNLSAVEASK
ncbi:MAG: acyl-CoA reductase [Flavobacteriales bacterium]|nr:acyl-CoA reductase [Flavobacteriales bacterium]